MSKISSRKFKCMKCGEIYDINTYDSVNVKEDPDLKERCLSGDIFQFECPHCHNTYMLSYPCLYNDSDKKFMVWLGDEEFVENSGSNNIFEKLNNSGFILRRCEDINSFIEKLQILDDGIDDRAVELAKYDSYIDYINNRKGNSEDVSGIYYHGIENDILKINIKNNDRGLTIMIPYEALVAEMDSHKDMFNVDNIKFPLVDSKWIIQIFEGAGNKA